MAFENAIERMGARFGNHGRFSLLPGESIKEVVSREKVPNAPAIYIDSERDD